MVYEKQLGSAAHWWKPVFPRCGTEQYITEHQTTVACASQLVATLFKNRFAELSCRRAATMIDSGQRDEVPRLSGYQRLLPDVEQQG